MTSQKFLPTYLTVFIYMFTSEEIVVRVLLQLAMYKI